MPISYYSTDDQQETLADYNQARKALEKMPEVPRNGETGWPLLQLSLLSRQDSDNGPSYTPMLGGGKCHGFLTVEFALASLLSKIPGKKDVSPGTVEQFNQNYIENLLYHFSFHHKHLGINISSASGAYGKTREITLPSDWDRDTFHKALEGALPLACKTRRYFPQFGHYANYHTTYAQIDATINPDSALFINGQVFIDLGDVFKAAHEIRADLARYFQVDEWLTLKKHIKDKESIESRKERELATINKEMASLPIKEEQCTHEERALYNEIKHMHDYGLSIASDASDKSETVTALAALLKEKLDNHIRLMKGIVIDKAYNPSSFQTDFIKTLHSEDATMATHRKRWKPIVLNIAIAFTGIGLLAMAGKAFYASATIDKSTINDLFFFGRTHSQDCISSINNALDTAQTQNTLRT